MPFGAEPLVLTEEERQELQQMTQSRTLPAGDVMRSRMVLPLAEGGPARTRASAPPSSVAATESIAVRPSDLIEVHGGLRLRDPLKFLDLNDHK